VPEFLDCPLVVVSFVVFVVVKVRSNGSCFVWPSAYPPLITLVDTTDVTTSRQHRRQDSSVGTFTAEAERNDGKCRATRNVHHCGTSLSDSTFVNNHGHQI